MDLRRHASHAPLLPPQESNDTIVSRLAQQDKVPWYRKPNLRLLYLLMIPTCLGVELTSGFDMSMINGLQAVPSWLEYFHHPHSASLGFMVALYSLGFVFAAPFVPSVVDKMGRRYPILLASIISIIGGTIQGFALNYTMFVVARFILGFANIFSIVAATSLVGELSYPNERVVMGGLFNNSYLIGAVAAAGLIYGTYAMPNDWGWRIPSLLQVVPNLLQVSFIWFLPESPRWLISRGKKKEAYAILVKYHAEGDENSEFVKAEYTQIEQTLELEQKVSQTKWNEVLSTPGMRKRVTVAVFLALSIQWCGVGLTSYFLSPVLDSIGIHDSRTKNIINVAKKSWSLVSGIVCAIIAPRYSRRQIFLTCTISLFVIFTAWTVANAEYSRTHNSISSQVVLVLIFLYSPAYNLGFTAMIYPYLVELFPFHVRARGLSIYQWCLRIAGFITQVMDPIGLDVAGWRWFIVYCVWNAIQVVFIYFMLPETSGRTLEELAFLYESGQDVFRHNVDETLCARREADTHYGSVENIPRTAGC